MFKLIVRYLSDLRDFLYPARCLGCQQELVPGEQYLCLTCSLELPLTRFNQHSQNSVYRRFHGRITLERAATWLSFQSGGLVQSLMHEFKYRNQPQLAVYLGKQAALDWQDSAYFETIDFLVPVPLHPRKRRLRSYNQAECIAQGLSEILKIPVEASSLVRKSYQSSQTKEHRFERWQKVSGNFTLLEDHPFTNRHLMLVDDVVTTGATLEACAQALLDIPGLKLSLFCLAQA